MKDRLFLHSDDSLRTSSLTHSAHPLWRQGGALRANIDETESAFHSCSFAEHWRQTWTGLLTIDLLRISPPIVIWKIPEIHPTLPTLAIPPEPPVATPSRHGGAERASAQRGTA